MRWQRRAGRCAVSGSQSGLLVQPPKEKTDMYIGIGTVIAIILIIILLRLLGVI
jgi:hypothetical protein